MAFNPMSEQIIHVATVGGSGTVKEIPKKTITVYVNQARKPYFAITGGGGGGIHHPSPFPLLECHGFIFMVQNVPRILTSIVVAWFFILQLS